MRSIDFLDLDALHDDWLRLHAEDVRATAFSSWPWLRAWAQVAPYPWSVLVARDGPAQRIVGLFPIGRRGSITALRLDQVREIHAMGDPLADYRGFICDPTFEDAAVDAFADFLLADRAWDRLILKDMLDDRVERLVDRVRARDDQSLDVETRQGTECPLLTLPDCWEDYLAKCLTQPSRKSLKKRLRIAAEAGCRLTTLGDSHPHEQLETLLRLAGMRGRNPPEHLQRCRALFESCITHGLAEVYVLRVGGSPGPGGDAGEPAAAQGSFIDRKVGMATRAVGGGGSIGHYLTGYDDRFADLSPGRVMDALCIQDAIARGFAAVDFLRGDEAYKHQLGAKPRYTHHAMVARRGFTTRVRTAIAGARRRIGL